VIKADGLAAGKGGSFDHEPWPKQKNGRVRALLGIGNALPKPVSSSH